MWKRRQEGEDEEGSDDHEELSGLRPGKYSHSLLLLLGIYIIINHLT